MDTVAELREEAARELLAAANAGDERRTTHLRRTASLFIRLREQFPDPFDRGADYTGRSKPYRETITAVFRDVRGEIDPKTLRQLQNQVRYHLSTAVREHLADRPDLLDEYGLNPKSVRERNADRIKQRRALVDAGIIDAEADAASHAARLVHGARYLAELAADEGLSDSTPEAKDYVREGVRQIVEKLSELVPPRDRIAHAHALLRSVDEPRLRRLAEPARSETDDDLTAILREAGRLRGAVAAEDTLGAIDDLLARYGRGRQDARKAQ